MSVVWEAALDGRSAGMFGAARESDWPCVISISVGGLLLGGLLMSMLKRGAPLTPGMTAFLAGVAALSIANIEACLTRPHAYATTVLLWHGMTVGIVALLFAAAGGRLLRWPHVHATDRVQR